VTQSSSCDQASHFVQVNKAGWPSGASRSGGTTYEYQVYGTDNCLTYKGAGPVDLPTCTAGRESAEFWRGTDGNQLINVDASVGTVDNLGTYGCLTGSQYTEVEKCEAHGTAT
jgi:hypothetical protein